MILRLTLVFFILAQNVASYAQNKIDYLELEKDSLRNKSDTEKAFYLKDKSILIGHPDSAFQMASLSIEFAQNCDCSNLLMACYFTTSVHAYYKGDYSTALTHQLFADSIAEADKTYDFYYQSKSLLGTIYNLLNDKINAITNYEKALLIAKKLNDSTWIADSYQNLGEVYLAFEDNDKAKNYKLKALNIYEKTNASLTSLFNVHTSLATLCEKKKGLRHLKKAQKIIVELELDYYTVQYLSTEGYYYNKHKNYKRAEKSFLKMNQLATEYFYPDLISYSSGMLGDIYKEMGRKQKAIYYYSIYLENENGMIENRAGILANIGELYGDKNNFEKAYYYEKLAYDLTDSLDKIKNTELLIKYDNKIENLENEDKITKQKFEIAAQKLLVSKERNNSYQIGFIALIILVILLVFFQQYFYRQKRKKQLLKTELKKEQELSDMRTVFLENIAHEIRTPITLINGHLDLALESLNTTTEVKKHIVLAQKNSSRVLSNANEILELLKLDKGELPLKQDVIAVDSFFKRIFNSFASLAEIKQLNLVYTSNIFKGLAIVSDENRLEKILNNYIANAIKFTPAKSTVGFNANIIDNMLEISVSDGGPGISKEEHQKVFTRFYQSKNNVNIGGVGVGLSIAKEYSESLGGSVSVQSEDGKGAIFSVKLPVVICNSNQNSVATETIINLAPKEELQLNLVNKPTILIVEDNPEMNVYLSEILAEICNCEVAFDGVEALQKIQTKHYSLLISDIMMPQMDGIELKQKINLLPNYKTVPFIFITAKAQMSDKLLAYDMGVDDFVVKPFEKKELISRVSNLLSSNKERENWIKDNLDFVNEKGSSNEQLLDKIKQTILKNIDNPTFKIPELAAEVGYSDRQLSRVVNKLIGLSPVQYILEIRLKKAHLYLVDKKFATVAETRNRVGISSPAYFNKKFVERFGIKPSEVGQ